MGKFNIVPEIDELVMKAVNQLVWPRWRGKHEAMKRACYYKTVGHRRRVFYRCELCGREGLERGDVQTDHILPRVPVEGYDSLDAWLKRTLCEADGLQVICKDPCHKEKTAKEAAERAEHRRAKKLKARKAKKKTRKVKRSKK